MKRIYTRPKPLRQHLVTATASIVYGFNHPFIESVISSFEIDDNAINEILLMDDKIKVIFFPHGIKIS